MRRFIPWLILLFPALELFVLIQVGKEIGALATIALVILSMGIGFTLLRLRGIHIAQSMRAELAAGRIPSNPIIDTFCLMAAGCLFIFPGFVSDALAILLLIPGFRHILLARAVTTMRSRGFRSQNVHFEASSGDSGPVSWTCATFSNARDVEPERRELRGNAVIIDCEPEDTPRGDNAASDNPKHPG